MTSNTTEYEKEELLSRFGVLVKKRRLEMDLTLEELANMLGYTTTNARSSILKLEKGNLDLPFSKLYKLCALLGISVDNLLTTDSFDETLKIIITKELEKKYGENCVDFMDTFSNLSPLQQAEIKGEMKQMIKQKKE